MTLAVWQKSEKMVRGQLPIDSVGRNAITALPNGGYVVSWREGKDIKFQIYDGEGAPIPQGFHSIAATTDDQNGASIQAIGTEGSFAVTWNQSVPNNVNKFSIQTQVFNYNGTSATAAIEIAKDLTIGQLDVPQIAPTANGGYVVVHDTGTKLIMTVHDVNGAVGITTDIVEGAVTLSDVTDLGDGRFVVSYTSGNAIKFKIVNPNQAAPQTDQTVADGRVNDIVSLGGAGFAVVYNNGNFVEAKFYDINGSVLAGDPIRLSAQGLDDGEFLSAVALRGGRVAVVMSEYVEPTPGTRTDNGDIFLKIINADGSVSSIPVPLNSNAPTDGTGQQVSPTIVEMADGRLAISWTDPNVTHSMITTVIVDPRIAAVDVNGTDRKDVFVASEYEGDHLKGSGGDDKLIGSNNSELRADVATGDTLNGGDGTDTVSYQYVSKVGTSTLGVTFDLTFGGTAGEAAGDSYISVENAIGSAYDDGITGTAGVNKLEGGLGSDTLNGGAGVDNMLGGSGNDVYYVDQTTDKADETGSTGGTDLVHSTATIYTLDDYVENLTLMGAGAISGTGNSLANQITGNVGNNTLKGGLGNDSLNGGAGSDVLDGGSGDDRFYVDRSSDRIVETSSGGTDRLYASASYSLVSTAYVESMATTSSAGTATISLTGNNIAQSIKGNAGTNTLKGEGGNDAIYGEAGSDRLYGGTGKDVLYGGGTDSKRDTFVFDTALNASTNVDTIGDFSTAYDRIELDNDIFTRAGSVGALKADAFITSTRALDREDRIIYDRATGALYYDADGTGSAAQIKFAQLSKGLAMSYTDFIIIN